MGILFALIGIGIFLVSLFVFLPITEFYLLALILLFISVVLIGVGGALVKEFDGNGTLEIASDECHYCNGSGLVGNSEDRQKCPRCGGTGLARPEDYQ